MLDALDLTRLHELEENGVQTQASLSRKLGAAKATIRRREHRLLNRHAVRALRYRTFRFWATTWSRR